jgi:hypothetical protein
MLGRVAILITTLCALRAGAVSAIAVDVSGDIKSTHLFSTRIEGRRIPSDYTRKDPERFRLVIVGGIVRAELQSDVGAFPRGTVLLASDGSNDVTVLDPAQRTWYQTTFGAIDATQQPALGHMKSVTSKVIRDEPANAPGGTGHRLVLVEFELPLAAGLVLVLDYRVDLWARADSRLEPARRMLNVLERRDGFALQQRFRNVMDVFPGDFPVAESISQNISAIGGVTHGPATTPSTRTFTLSDPAEVEVTEADFTVPSTYAKVESPFRVTR